MQWITGIELPKKDGRYFVIGVFYPHTNEIKACVEFSSGFWHMGKGSRIVKWWDETPDPTIDSLRVQLARVTYERDEAVREVERLKGLLTQIKDLKSAARSTQDLFALLQFISNHL